MIYTVKKEVEAREPPHFRREYLTGNQGERNEPRGSSGKLGVTTAKSVADKELKEQIVSQTTIRLHEVRGRPQTHPTDRYRQW